jgi:hypothetical protein
VVEVACRDGTRVVPELGPDVRGATGVGGGSGVAVGLGLEQVSVGVFLLAYVAGRVLSGGVELAESVRQDPGLVGRGWPEEARLPALLLCVLLPKALRHMLVVAEQWRVPRAGDADRDWGSLLDGEAAADDRDRYLAENIFWVPKQARWSYLLATRSRPRSARSSTTPWRDRAREPAAQGGPAEGLLAARAQCRAARRHRHLRTGAEQHDLAAVHDEPHRPWNRGDIRWNNGGTFLKNALPDLRADYILANPPFNVSDWSGERLRDDVRWKYGVPPAGYANFACSSTSSTTLAPGGTTGVVLTDGSMSSKTSGEGEIRRALIEGDVVGCMVALPGQVTCSPHIPVCVRSWAKDRANGVFMNRRGRPPFIDPRKARSLWRSNSDQELTAADDARITGVYHA